MNAAEVRNEIEDAFRRYLEVYWGRRSVEQTLQMVTAQTTGFGTGRDEVALTEHDMVRLYRRDLEEVPSPVSYEVLRVAVVPLTEEMGVVAAVLNMRATVADQEVAFLGMRLSLVFVRGGGTWRIAHMHLSLPTAHHTEGEAYPTMQMERRAVALRRLVARKTEELRHANEELRNRLAEIRTLHGLLPICARCKRIRDDQGYWTQLEAYLTQHSEAKFSHSLCPSCAAALFPDLAKPGPPGEHLHGTGSGR
ncbi:MAG: nuclear transport factor 2 family protein [Kiritimatiellae bacterium]|nr:nuclear transport factor 2 family protein [Kiritimatiellia bacterium]